mgnify:CR=1 FL=1
MSRARRAEPRIEYEHVDITQDIAGTVTSFSYTDVASGEADSISLKIEDREKKWLGGWAPQKGDRMSASMQFYDWIREGDNWGIYCGSFQVDDVSMDGPPASCTIGAVSIPRKEAFNEEERTKNWEDATVHEIAAEIAERAGIELVYEADEIPVKALEQDKQTDCKFLYSVCEKYGLAMKVFGDKIIIFDEARYEAAPPVLTLRFQDFARYAYNSTLAGTYTGAKVSYSDPGSSKDHVVTVGGGSRIKEINVEADSAEDAKRKAVAALNNANKKAVTFSGTVMARMELIASQCINITGFGIPDGTYYLDKVTSKIGAGGASQQSFEAHRVGYRMDNAMIQVDPEEEKGPEGAVTAYTVQKGDTLWKIAEELLGSPLRYAEIYNLNKEVIEAEARERGKKDSSNGHWLFPGTQLQIPPVEVDENGGQ